MSHTYLKNKGVDSIIREYLLPAHKKVKAKTLRKKLEHEIEQRKITSLSKFDKELMLRYLKNYTQESKCDRCRLSKWRFDPKVSIVKRITKYSHRGKCGECNYMLHKRGDKLCPCDDCEGDDHDEDPECKCEYCRKSCLEEKKC
jgi:hypothetical protein